MSNSDRANLGKFQRRGDSPEVVSHGRMKLYPASGQLEIMCASRPVFRLPGWEKRLTKREAEEAEDMRIIHLLGWDKGGVRAERSEAQNAENLARAARRAAAALRDLALSNSFAWFVTLTLDKEKVDRYDVAEITRKLNNWLDNNVRRVGLVYILVPERHKDGAIHFHGLFNDVPGFVPSGTWNVPGHRKPIRPRSQKQAVSWATAGYSQVYNFERWGLGFTTGIRLHGEYPKAVAYVCKYIRKQIDPVKGQPAGKIGGRWYYSGGALKRPEVEYIDLSVTWMRENCPNAYFFEIEAAGCEYGIYRAPMQAASLPYMESEFTKAGLSPAGENPGENREKAQPAGN